MTKISCQAAREALYSIDNPALSDGEQMEAYYVLEEFIEQVNDLMRVRTMIVPMLLKAKENE